ncbi:MAG: hypothetical protein R6V85_14730 [Polyangia bacterium]
MREIALVGAVLGLIALVGALRIFDWIDLMVGGAWVLAAGWVFGLPAGITYHVLLYRTLRKGGEMPEKWILRPGQLNRSLGESERRRVMPWWYAGGGGFFLIVIGLVLVAIGMISGLSQA